MEQVDSLLVGSNYPAINNNDVKSIKIPLPPLPEQHKIATILTSVDNKIEVIDEQIAKTEQLKKGLMQKLLTEGIGHTEFKESEIGRIPKEWEIMPFIELADKSIKNSFTGGPFGSDLKSEHYTDNGVRIIQLQNIGDGTFLNNDFVYTSEEKAEQLKSCQILPGDIILAKMADPVARACIIPDLHNKYLMCSDGIRLKVDNTRFNTKYIFYSINHNRFRDIAIARSTGTTRSRIGLSALKTIPIVVPPLPEQKQIAKILSTTDDKLDTLREKKTQYEQLKKGLMQKLLTGEVRVKEAHNE
jgi:type I restriction enzyme S subunit